METIQKIIRIVEYFYCMIPGTYKSKTRKREVVQARQLMMYFAKELTKYSLTDIGKFIGGKDHATVLHGIKTVRNLVETEKQYAFDFQEIKERINKAIISEKIHVILWVKYKTGEVKRSEFDSTSEAQRSYNTHDVLWANMSVEYTQTEPDIQMKECEMNFIAPVVSVLNDVL